MKISSFSVVFVGMALAACSGPLTLDEARNAAAPSSEFSRALHQRYVSRAESEKSEADWPDTETFAQKALSAARSGDVQPDDFSDRDIDSEYRSALAAARSRLIAARDGGGKIATPLDLAEAQTAFDCWMQEQEENWQPDHIAACQRGFESAMARVEAALAVPEPEPEPEPMPVPQPAPEPEPLPGPYTVFFDFDSATLSDQARQILDIAAEDIGEANVTVIRVAGHTDTSGTNAYNMALSQRRLNAVIAYLVSRGVAREDIASAAYGEERPAVATGDNIREPRNRRVEIDVE